MKTQFISVLAALSLSVPVVAEPLTLTPDMLGAITPQAVEAGNVVTVEAVGFDFWDEESDDNNVTGAFPIGAPGDIWTGIGWDAVSTSVGGSWGSEMTIGFSADSDLLNKDLFLTVSSTDAPVSMEMNSSGGVVKFSDLTFPDLPLVDGMVYYELFESFDDEPDAIDGFWEPGGMLSFQVIPEPGAGPWLFLSGLVGLCMRRGRDDALPV